MSNVLAFFGRQHAGLVQLWRYRSLVAGLTARNLKVKYKRSVLGFVWTLVNPLVTVGILVAIFTHVVRVPIEHYWAFLISGYFVWNFLGQTMHSGTYVLAEHGELSRAVAYPKEAPIVAATLSKLVEFCIELTLVTAALAVFHHGAVPTAFVLLPVLVLIQAMMALGIAFPIATLSAFFHDVQHAVPILLTTLFYVSPVFYSADLVPESVRSIYMANPVAGLLTLFQTVAYSGTMPTPRLFLIVIAMASVLLIAGYGIFRRFERLVAEVV